MPLAIGWLSDWIFHVTGALGRASGYGAPEMPPVPNCDVFPPPLLSLPELTFCWAPLPHAARLAAAVGMAIPAAAARRKKSRRLMRERSFGCGMDPPSTGRSGTFVHLFASGRSRRLRQLRDARPPRLTRGSANEEVERHLRRKR